MKTEMIDCNMVKMDTVRCIYIYIYVETDNMIILYDIYYKCGIDCYIKILLRATITVYYMIIL